MKRTIIACLALCALSTSQAQNTSDNWALPFLTAGQPVLSADGTIPVHGGPQRSAADGVYYQRPEGAFYQGVSPADWGYYPVTKIVVQPWHDITYLNMAGASAQWSIEGTAAEADAGGNYTEQVEPIPEGFIDHYMPTVSVGGASYTLGENHENWGAYHASIAWADSIVEMSVYDPGRIIGQSGSTVFTNFRPLSMSAGYKYNYGTMSFQNGGSTYYCRGIRQFFEKPMGRLWVEDVTIPAISYSPEPVMYGQWITMTISKVDVADGRKTAGETIATLLCHWNDIVNIGQQAVSDGTVQMLSLVFKPGEEVILDEPFAITIEGFQDDGVDLGLAAALIDPCDAGLAEPAAMLLQNASHEDISATLTFSTRVPCISIRGMYDGIRMVSAGDALSLTAPTEGGDCTLEGQTAAAKVQMKTAIRWNYGTEEANYEIEGLPEWLHATVDESKREINGGNYGHGLVTLTLRADAVPEGTPDREATLLVKGKGVEGAESITVFQKGCEESGISSVDGDGGATDGNVTRYSLDGKRLPATAKGLVIENGKKRVQR